jgi:hypothetical protein
LENSLGYLARPCLKIFKKVFSPVVEHLPNGFKAQYYKKKKKKKKEETALNQLGSDLK